MATTCATRAHCDGVLTDRLEETMTVATVQFMSDALWREVTYTALVPDTDVASSGPYPVLLLLHGGNQNYSSWLHYSTLRARVADLPLLVVLPDGAQSRW